MMPNDNAKIVNTALHMPRYVAKIGSAFKNAAQLVVARVSTLVRELPAAFNDVANRLVELFKSATESVAPKAEDRLGNVIRRLAPKTLAPA